MSIYAKVLNNKVEQTILADPSFFEHFIDVSPGEWIDTTGILNAPSIGDLYEPTVPAFYKERFYESWNLNKDTYLWEAPVARPTDDKTYTWNEETQAWDEDSQTWIQTTET